MTLSSMTGFGRAQGEHDGVGWLWELRSVNGRGLDVRLRLPPGAEAVEPQVRARLGSQLARGSVTAQLSLKRESGAVSVRINEEALAKVLFAAARLQAETGARPPSVDGLLALRGVLEVDEPADAELLSEQRTQALLASLDHAIGELTAARRSEGSRLADVLQDQLAEIERLTAAVSASPARSPEAIRARLADQVRRLTETGLGLEPERLHQEAVLIATRADVEEELKRLGSHVAAARDLVASGEPVGRKLDFLSQEFNREANTLCSKSNATEITRLGLALKVVIDQFREQVQNIE
ncbi:MAG: YicC/YloC family endoribonuclease [Hyphomicrobiaceae bacterium]